MAKAEALLLYRTANPDLELQITQRLSALQMTLLDPESGSVHCYRDDEHRLMSPHDFWKLASNEKSFIAYSWIPGDRHYVPLVVENRNHQFVAETYGLDFLDLAPTLDFLNRLIIEFRSLQSEEKVLVVDFSGLTHEQIDWLEFFANPDAVLPEEAITEHTPDAIGIKESRIASPETRFAGFKTESFDGYCLASRRLRGTLALRLDPWLQPDIPTRVVTEDLPGVVHFPWAFEPRMVLKDES